MISKFSTQLLIFFFINQLSSVYTQNIQQISNSGHVYISLIILIFFLFTVFGILTAFLIKHKPRRRALPAGRMTKDVENSGSEDIGFLENENPNDIASFDFLEKNKPAVLHFDEPKTPFDDPNEKAPDITVKTKLLKDYLNQQSSDEFESKSPDSLNELDREFRDSLGPESLSAQSSPEFTEIPKGLIANAEEKDDDEQLFEPKDADTFSDAYTFSADDRKSEQIENELDIEDKKSDDLLKNMLETKNSLTKLLNKRDRKNPLHSSDDSIDQCMFCSDTYEGNKKKGEIELEKMAKQNEIPESSTFPDSSDNESMKSTKSYHSYGFPLENENMTSDSLAQKSATEFILESSLQNPTQRWNKLYKLKLEKPSDYDQMMRNMNPPNSKEDISSRDKNSDEKSEASTESSQKYEFKTIVCSDDPNAKASSSVSSNDQPLSPEETDPSKLLEALNESENSEYSQSNKSSDLKQTNQQAVREQQVESLSEKNSNQFNAIRLFKSADETGSLKTLNSLDTSLDDYSIQKKPSQLHPKATKSNKSVLNVLEKFDNKM